MKLQRAAPPPPHLRCRRTDGRQWRCHRSALPKARFCEHHHRLLQLNQAKHLAATTTIAVAAELKPPSDRPARELRRRREMAPVAAPSPDRPQREAHDRPQREAVPATAAPLDRRLGEAAPAVAPPPGRRLAEAALASATAPAPGHEGEAETRTKKVSRVMEVNKGEAAPAAAPPPGRCRAEAAPAPATEPGHEEESETHTKKESRVMEVNAVEALVVTGCLPNGVMTTSPRGFDNAAVAADLKPPPDRPARELRRRRGTAPVAAPPPDRRRWKVVPVTAAARDRRQQEAVPPTAGPLDRRLGEAAPAAAPPPGRLRAEVAPAPAPGHEGEALVVTGYLPNGVMTTSPRGFDNAEPVADEEVEVGGRLIQRQFRSKHAELVQVSRRQKGLPYRICSPIAWKRACS